MPKLQNKNPQSVSKPQVPNQIFTGTKTKNKYYYQSINVITVTRMNS